MNVFGYIFKEYCIIIININILDLLLRAVIFLYSEIFRILPRNDLWPVLPCLTSMQLRHIKTVIYTFQPFQDPISSEIMTFFGNLQRLTVEVCENACGYV